MEKQKNQKVKDSSSKLIFGDPRLCAQFLRDFIDVPLLKNVKEEDIEDVSERYLPLFTTEREADTVKKVKLTEYDSIYLISLIEHKTEVDYNVVMQLFRYMCYIWEDYEKEIRKKISTDVTRSKDFCYPPILPIVYYEGKGEWTAVTNFKERIFLNDIFSKYVPNFSYELVRLHDYSNDELIQNQDEISLLMMLNKLQDIEDFTELVEIARKNSKIWNSTPEYLLDIIAKITVVLLSRFHLPEEEVEELVGQIKERNMPELFEHFKGYDVQATRQEAKKEGREEGREIKVVSLVCKKIVKKQTIEEIAEALEEDVDTIRFISEVACKYIPDYNVEEIYQEVVRERSKRS